MAETVTTLRRLPIAQTTIIGSNGRRACRRISLGAVGIGESTLSWGGRIGRQRRTLVVTWPRIVSQDMLPQLE